MPCPEAWSGHGHTQIYPRIMKERRARMKGLYGKGLLLVAFGGAGLAEHITSGRGSFPISAVVFGLGFILICMSYGKKKDRR